MILFANFGAGDPCFFGKSQRATIRGPGGREAWRTSRGLRLGDGVRRVRRLYPRARRRGRAYWLATGRTHIGDCPPRGCLLPVLKARIRDRHVSAFDLTIGAAGD